MKQHYRFRYYRGTTVTKNSFEARRIVIATLLKTKVWYMQNQINERSKHPNRTVNPQVFITTAKNSNIAVFLYMIYQGLKLQYRPALAYG